MSVKLTNNPYYFCVCDNCKTTAKVERTSKIYNAAQAVRSLGWSFGRDRQVYCVKCRQRNYFDNYKYYKQ